MTRLALLVLAACNQALGLEQAGLIDSATADRDRDGIADVVDNCVDLLNPAQSDEDGDGIGDGCDNCPLVANRTQEQNGDVDAVGDACDAHPVDGGDCLIAFDSFADPLTFETRWRVLAILGFAPSITPMPGYLAVAPSTQQAAMIALDESGVPLTGVFDVQLAARVTIMTGRLMAISNASDYRSGYGCGLYAFAPNLFMLTESNGSLSGIGYGESLSTEPVGRETLFRLRPPSRLTPLVTCRADHGFAVATNTIQPSAQEIPVGGSPGVRFLDDPSELTAIALYRYQPGEPCPQTVATAL